MNAKTFPHAPKRLREEGTARHREAPGRVSLQGGTRAGRRHKFTHAPNWHWQADGCCSQGSARPAGERFR